MYGQAVDSWPSNGNYSSANLFDHNPHEYQIDDEGRFASTSAPPPPPGPSPSLLYSSPARIQQINQQKRTEMSSYTPTKIGQQKTSAAVQIASTSEKKDDAIQLHKWYIGLQATSQATSYFQGAKDIKEWIQVFGIRYNKGDKGEEGEVWHSSLILERVSANKVKSKSGKVYELVGSFDDNACSEKKKISDKTIFRFKDGFPIDWKDLVVKEAIYRKDERRKKKSQAKIPANPSEPIIDLSVSQKNVQTSNSTIHQQRSIKSGKQLPESKPQKNIGKKRKALFRYDNSEDDESEYYPTSDEDKTSKAKQSQLRPLQREEQSQSRTPEPLEEEEEEEEEEEDDDDDEVDYQQMTLDDADEGEDSDGSEYGVTEAEKKRREREDEKRRKAERDRRRKSNGRDEVDFDDGMSVVIESPPNKKKPSAASNAISRELMNLSKTGFGNLTLVQNAIMEQLEENRAQKRRSGRQSMPSLSGSKNKFDRQHQPFTPQNQITRKIETPRSSRRIRTPVRPWWEVGPQERKKKRPEMELQPKPRSNSDLVDLTLDSSHDSSIFVPSKKASKQKNRSESEESERIAKKKIENAEEGSSDREEISPSRKRSGSNLIKPSEKRQKKASIAMPQTVDDQDLESDDEEVQAGNDESVNQPTKDFIEETTTREDEPLNEDFSDNLQYINDAPMLDESTEIHDSAKDVEEQDDERFEDASDDLQYIDDTQIKGEPIEVVEAVKDVKEQDGERLEGPSDDLQYVDDAKIKNEPIQMEKANDDAEKQDQISEFSNSPNEVDDHRPQKVEIELQSEFEVSITKEAKTESSEIQSDHLAEELPSGLPIDEESQDASAELSNESVMILGERTTDVSESMFDEKGGSSKATSVSLSEANDEIIEEKVDNAQQEEGSTNLIVQVDPSQQDKANSEQIDQQQQRQSSKDVDFGEYLLNSSVDTQMIKESDATNVIASVVEAHSFHQVKSTDIDSPSLPAQDTLVEPIKDVDVSHKDVSIEEESIIAEEDELDDSDEDDDEEVEVEQTEEGDLDNDAAKEVEALIVVASEEEKQDPDQCEPFQAVELANDKHSDTKQEEMNQELVSVPSMIKEGRADSFNTLVDDQEEKVYPNLSQTEEMEVSVEFEGLEITSFGIDHVKESKEEQNDVKAENVELEQIRESQELNGYLDDFTSIIRKVEPFVKGEEMIMQKTPLSPAEDGQMDMSDDDDESELAPEDFYYFSD